MSFSDEIDAISRDGYSISKKVNLEAIVHTPETDIAIFKVISLEVMSDYVKNISDHNYIRTMLSYGDLMHHVLPYIHNLEMTLYITRGNEEISNRYKFVPDNLKSNPKINSSTSASELNKDSIGNLEGQLLDRGTELMRTLHIDGIYRNTSLDNVIMSGIKDSVSKIDIAGNKPKMLFNKVELDNHRVYSHVNIPYDTKLNKIADVLQDKYGLYNGGCGLYYVNNDKYISDKYISVYLYPLSGDYSNRGKDRILEIYSSIGIEYQFHEHNYAVYDSSIKIVSGDSNYFTSVGEQALMSGGDSIDFIESDSMMYRNADVSEDGVSLDRYDRGNRFKHIDRADDVTYVTPSNITNNHYNSRSKILKKYGSNVQVEWTNSDSSLLIPGMRVVFNYEMNGDSEQYYGILHGAFTSIDESTSMSVTLLNIFINGE